MSDVSGKAGGWVNSISASPVARPTRRVAKGEFQREAKRVLPRLAATKGGVLILSHTDGRYGLQSTRTRGGKPRTKVDSQIISAFLREELLCDGEGGYVLSELGRNWVARNAGSADPFRAQHQIDATRMIDGRGAGTSTALTPMRVNLAETPLGWLRRRKGADGKALVSEAQFEAGEKLRADFTIAQMTPRITADWMQQADGGKRAGPCNMEMSEKVVAARQRFYKAVEAIGPGLAEPVVDVCCYLSGLEDAERKMGWPQRTGKVVLAIALERLADHYGFNGNKKNTRNRYAWHAQSTTEDTLPNNS